MKTEWIYLSDALNNLMPNGIGLRGTVEDYEILNNTDSIPSDSEIDDEIIRLKAEYDANEYARNRASAYDSIGNQLDMIYKDNLNGTTTHKDSVEAVKAQFPKPE